MKTNVGKVDNVKSNKNTPKTQKGTKNVKEVAKNIDKSSENVDNGCKETEENVNKKATKNVSFWIGMCASVVVVLQFVLSQFGVDVQTKILVEVCSVVLTVLVSLGVLKMKKGPKNLTEIKKEIEDKTNKKIEKKK